MTSQFMCMVRGRLCLLLTAILALTMITHLGFVALLIDQQIAAHSLLERSLGARGSAGGQREGHSAVRNSRDLSHVTNPNLYMGTPTVRFTTPSSMSYSKPDKSLTQSHNQTHVVGVKRKSSVQIQNGIKVKVAKSVGDISRTAGKTLGVIAKQVVTNSSGLRNVKIESRKLGRKDQEHVRGSGRELTVNSTNYRGAIHNRTRAGIKLLQSNASAGSPVGPKQNMIQHFKDNLRHPLVPASPHQGAAPSAITQHTAAAKASGKKLTYLRNDTSYPPHKNLLTISKQSQAKESVISHVSVKVGTARQVQARPSHKEVPIPKRNRTNVTTTVSVNGTKPGGLNAHKKRTSREVLVGKLHSPGNNARSGKSHVSAAKSGKGNHKPKMAAWTVSPVNSINSSLPRKVAMHHLESSEAHIVEYNIDRQKAVWEAADDMLDTHLILHKTPPKKKAKQQPKGTTKAKTTTLKPSIKPPSVKKTAVPPVNKKIHSSGHS